MKKSILLIVFAIMLGLPMQAGLCRDIRDIAHTVLTCEIIYVGFQAAVKYGLINIPDCYLGVGKMVHKPVAQ